MYVFYKKVNFNHIYSSIIKKVRNLFEKCSSLYKKTFKIMFFFLYSDVQNATSKKEVYLV